MGGRCDHAQREGEALTPDLKALLEMVEGAISNSDCDAHNGHLFKYDNGVLISEYHPPTCKRSLALTAIKSYREERS